MKNLMISALQASGESLLRYFNKPLNVKYKESHSSIVTDADFESDRIITGMIRAKYPSHNIISEESGFTDKGSEYTWIIDPLDGTSNFASGVPWFGTMIALLKGNTPVMGGVYLPADGLLYFAAKGEGAYRNGKPLPRLKERDAKDSLMAVCIDYSDDAGEFANSIRIYSKIVKGARNIRATNSLVDYLYVIEGKFGGVINFNTKIWDISPLSVMLGEVGGVLKSIDGNDISFSVGPEAVDDIYPAMAGTPGIVEFFKDIVIRD